MFLWAGNFIVVKSAVAVLPPIGSRSCASSSPPRRCSCCSGLREGSLGIPRRDLLAIMGFGALGFGVYQILWTTGLTTVPAGTRR